MSMSREIASGLPEICDTGRRLELVPSVIDTEAQTSSPNQEDVFLPELKTLPSFGNTAETLHIRQAPEMDQPYGKTWYKKVQMDTGTRYSVVIGQPRKQQSDTAFLFTTALGTRIEDTYNLSIANDIMELGIPVIGIGPEENDSISIAETAHNMHAIADNTDSLGLYEPSSIFVGGDSRGAMVANGIMAMAKANKRQVADAYLIDPCLARPIHYTDLREQGHYARSSIIEAISLARQVRRMSADEKYNHIRRLKLSPRIIGRTALPLKSGQAGELARHIDTDQKAHVVLFLGSIANQYKIWEAVFNEYPNVTTEQVKGSHISLLRKDVREARKEYMANARDQLDDQAA